MTTLPGEVRYPLARVTYGPDEVAAVLAALHAGQTTCGPRVAAFERGFASYVGAADAVMVNSGTSADLLLALSLGRPYPRLDEILVPAVTWPTQVWACVLAGYRVRLVDCDPATLQMDLDDLERKLDAHGRQTVAVFAAHILGNVGDMDRLRALTHHHGVLLFEDACEALGARWKGQHVGTFGQAGAFSFFFSHVLNTMEGGMVTTAYAGQDAKFRLWRAHGWEPKDGEHFRFPTWGLNLRPTELQGAFGGVQLGRLDGFLAARQTNAERLARSVFWEHPELRGVEVPPYSRPAWHGFPLTVAPDAPFTKRDLCDYLEAHGVETRPLVAGNLARQPAFQNDDRVIVGPLPGADAIHDRAFYIGLASHDDPEGTGYVGEVVADFLRTGGYA